MDVDPHLSAVAESLRRTADAVELGYVSTLILMYETTDASSPLEVRVVGDRTTARDPMLGVLAQTVYENLASGDAVRVDWEAP